MDIHNTNEDIVFNSVQNIFEEIQNSGNPEGLCLCYQCRMDTMCYTLNRVEPHYIISNRGFTRIDQSGIKRQQIEADISTLVYRGLRVVNHNMRPTAPHDGSQHVPPRIPANPIFDIPTIVGRIFDGVSFEPIVDTTITLYCDGELVHMRNSNWQNPCTIITNIPGSFSFWPSPVVADLPDLEHTFKFSIKAESSNYEPLYHFFSINATSKFHTPHSYTLNRTYKLPDLYIFPPGEAELNG
jgi:competence protein ComFB